MSVFELLVSIIEVLRYRDLKDKSRNPWDKNILEMINPYL